MDCPSDDDLLAFARGRLPAGRMESVHTHLDACETCQRVLAEAARALATALTAPLPGCEAGEWHTMFQKGALVGRRYTIERFITRGGMGEVYEAFDRELLQRVALKTVTATASDNSRAVRRLKEEVQLARRVSHPNVCRIYDLGTHVMPGTGTPIHFLTMEFVEGETLGQRVRLTGALSMSAASKVARELLLALRAAHAANVLHRDFKSDNVMLHSDPCGHGMAVVLDFGLARALDDDQAPGSQSNLVGTFGYIAPEQLEGAPHSKASDIYAFGVVWFELLTGQLPFESTSSPGMPVPKARRGAPPAPSRFNAAVPTKLDPIVQRCLERNPEDRFQTVDDVLAALDKLTPPRVHSRRLLVVQAFGALSLCALGAYSILRYSEGSESEPTAIAPPAPEELQDRNPSEDAPDEPLGPADAEESSVATIIVPVGATTGVTPPRGVRPPHSPSIQQPTKAATEKSLAAPFGRAPAAEGRDSEPPAEPPSAPPSAAAPSAPSVPPAAPKSNARPRSEKPDWENPFGEVQPTGLASDNARTPG